MAESGDVIKTWTDTDRARVLADYASGLNYEQISRLRNIPSTTVRRWISKYGPATSEEARSNYSRILVRSQAALMDYLDTVEASGPQALLKSGFTLNAIAGTSFDKLFRNPEPSPEQPRQLIIVIPGMPDPVTISAPDHPQPEAEYTVDQEHGTGNKEQDNREP